MRVEVLASAEDVASRAASEIANHARETVAERGVFLLAVSGGKTPWMMLEALSRQELPWDHVHIFQVDERVAPDGDPDRNLTHLKNSLSLAPMPARQIHSMPVEVPDLKLAADQYASVLHTIAGLPPVLDLVHLGMGADGHTASLIPGDAVLEVDNKDVAGTGNYQGRQRLTLTYPVLNRARRILWVITGGEKASMFPRLVNGDASIPAGRINREHASVLADQAAARTTRL
jgi:6-phosphogluconolactonase